MNNKVWFAVIDGRYVLTGGWNRAGWIIDLAPTVTAASEFGVGRMGAGDGTWLDLNFRHIGSRLLRNLGLRPLGGGTVALPLPLEGLGTAGAIFRLGAMIESLDKRWGRQVVEARLVEERGK